MNTDSPDILKIAFMKEYMKIAIFSSNMHRASIRLEEMLQEIPPHLISYRSKLWATLINGTEIRAISQSNTLHGRRLSCIFIDSDVDPYIRDTIIIPMVYNKDMEINNCIFYLREY